MFHCYGFVYFPVSLYVRHVDFMHVGFVQLFLDVVVLPLIELLITLLLQLFFFQEFFRKSLQNVVSGVTSVI